MSEDRKPIFPRSSERSEEETAEIRQKTKQNLEITEQIFEQKITCSNCQTENSVNTNFCWVCEHSLSLTPTTPPSTNPQRFYDMVDVYGPPPMLLEDNLDEDLHTTVYGPPPMELDFDPPTLPNIKIDKDPIPPMPMIAPAYGPPPMRLTEPKNKLFWLAIGLLLVFFVTAIIFLILFFIFR